MTVTIPTSEAQYGYVVGRVIRALGDTTDADDKPDAIHATNSYASPGEEYVYEFGADGEVEMVRMAGIQTWPYEVYKEKYQVNNKS